jgi:mRNA-degrading endonuclease RelE of RelBE toxin-antitoxin system
MGADSERFVVRVSLFAREQFREKKALAEQSPNSTHAKTWRVIRDIVNTRLCRPGVALESAHAMKRDLANLFRWKFGRNRLIYLASSEKRQVTILLVGFRNSEPASASAPWAHERQSRRRFPALASPDLATEPKASTRQTATTNVVTMATTSHRDDGPAVGGEKSGTHRILAPLTKTHLRPRVGINTSSARRRDISILPFRSFLPPADSRRSRQRPSPHCERERPSAEG